MFLKENSNIFPENTKGLIVEEKQEKRLLKYTRRLLINGLTFIIKLLSGCVETTILSV